MHAAAFIVALALAPPGKHHDTSWYRPLPSQLPIQRATLPPQRTPALKRLR